MPATLSAICGAVILCSAAPDEPSQAVETGSVHWHRDFDAACQVAKKQDKPVLLLFQEIPG